MAFVKGQSGNPLGRPRFTAVDEINKQLRHRKKHLIQEIFECIDAIPEEEKRCRLPHLFKLMDFLYSKPKEIEILLEQAVEIVKEAVRNRGAEQPNQDAGNPSQTALPPT